jgi:thiol-disulfide isomerase/thioredoxin
MSFAFVKNLRFDWPKTGLIVCLTGLLFLTACSSGSTETASTTDRTNTNTPTGTKPPRAMYPMPPTTAAAPAHDSSAANANSFTLLDNRRMRLSDYLGRVVVLDFYATWCPPCRAETPHLVSLQRRYGPQGLQIIGLNVGGPEDKEAIPGFVQEYGIQYTLAFPDPAMTELYLSDDDRIPQSFVFDRKGKLVKRFISYDNSMPAELEQVIKEALAVE